MGRRKRIASEVMPFQFAKPMADQFQHVGNIKFFVSWRVLFQVGLRAFEQGRRRPKAVFLQVHKSARELDQALVKVAFRSVTDGQPEFFEHFMRFVKQTPVKTFEIAEVVSIVLAALASFDQRGDLGTLFAYALRLKIRGHSCNTHQHG